MRDLWGKFTAVNQWSQLFEGRKAAGLKSANCVYDVVGGVTHRQLEGARLRRRGIGAAVLPTLFPRGQLQRSFSPLPNGLRTPTGGTPSHSVRTNLPCGPGAPFLRKTPRSASGYGERCLPPRSPHWETSKKNTRGMVLVLSNERKS